MCGLCAAIRTWLSASRRSRPTAGASPRGIQSPDGASIGGVAFEPAGGLNKAIFFGGGKWLANSDGSGNWLALSGDYCWWAGRHGICATLAASSSSATFVATTDDG